MSFLSIIMALLIEQAKPLARGNAAHSWVLTWLRWTTRQFDTGRRQSAWVVWFAAALVPAVVVALVYQFALRGLGWPAALLWDVAVLYATLGFRQFSHHFSEVRDAIDRGDTRRGAQALAAWQQVRAGDIGVPELVRLLIEHSVLAAHRHVFGVLAWFTLLALFGLGPAGAVIYRIGEFAARYWLHSHALHPPSEALKACAQSAWTVIDWIPARMTAVGFAVVGSFEDAVDAWRRHVQQHPADNDGVVLAAAAGALGVQLGGQRLRQMAVAAQSGPLQAEDTLMAGVLPVGDTPDPAHLRALVGLVWRSVVLWVLVLALLALARWTG